MATQTFIILTGAERTAAMALNNASSGVDPRAIDNPLAGYGLNLNPDATSCAVGAPVELAGKYAAPARILNDPENARYWPSLSLLPRATLDEEVIFLPGGDG